MGIIARYPIALAPGMGLNAYFTYTVCLKMHIPWQTALGAVFLSGCIFLALTAAGIRQMILRSIPHELYAAVASGIGLFIAFIGFRNSGLVVGDPATLVGLGNIRNPTPALAFARPHPHGRPPNQAREGLHPHRRSRPSPPPPGPWRSAPCISAHRRPTQ
jgi:xanthine/uracil/vitamin C permease (AzgA family)